MATKRTTIIELEPTIDGKKASSFENICLEDGDVKPSHWLGIFHKLANLTNQDENRGEKVVHLKDLKNYVRSTSSYQIGTYYIFIVSPKHSMVDKFIEFLLQSMKLGCPKINSCH